MLALTGPRVQTRMRPYDKPLELDARLYARARVLIERALEGGRHLTREELSAALRRGRIHATGQRLAHLVMHAELEGSICSGPRRGKQFTYALLAERAPRARTLPREEALARLARRYFASHGPATLRDFVWWSGLEGEGRRRCGVALGKVDVLPSPPQPSRAAGADYLLPNYDEYLIAYRDRDAVVDAEPGPHLRVRQRPGVSRTRSCWTAAWPAAGGGSMTDRSGRAVAEAGTSPWTNGSCARWPARPTPAAGSSAAPAGWRFDDHVENRGRAPTYT